MMENLLSTSSSLIETSSATSQSERGFPVTDAEFDGETVLCRVCGDRASGFHYGVHACEGCKGFFRRSIQQKIQYRPCLKNQQCNIQRVNRNRCQYCRLKKCISVGMSRDAVRFGRVPKKEKERIMKQMQKKTLASQSGELNSLLANDFDVVQDVVTAHRRTCDITQLRAHQMRDVALHKQEYINCPANMACPLNNEIGMDANANRNNLSDFSESFTPAIKSVVDFAKGIPGFVLLNQDDQVTLLKAGTFEVLLVRLACLFDPHSNTMMFTGGKLFKRQPSTMTTNAGFLLDSMFDFAERFNKMCLIDDEIALFSAVVLLSPDRPGLRNVEQVEKIQNKLTEALQNMVNTNHKEDGTLFAKLLMKTTDLRTLNTLHSEKSIAGQRSGERRERQNTDDCDMDFQDSLSTRSSRSSPTLSETSNMTMTSGYSGETDGGSLVIGQRLPLDAAGHQVVLRTPYGTFFREEGSGFYGMMTDMPRRRCNTLDRDTLTRPRLHTIEEGNRRRYTLDKDYINKMANRLSDRLETRNAMRGDSLPPSMSNSATSSPIQEEGSGLYSVPPATSFAPISVPDGNVNHSSAIINRTSPLAGSEAKMAAVRTVSSPVSPKSRSRSGSFTQEDYSSSRPRCYSFNLNSDGRAARMSLHRMLVAEQGQDGDAQMSPDSGHYLSAEMRRGSIGAFGLHSQKRHPFIDRAGPFIRGRADMDNGADADGLTVMKHIMPDGSVYGIQLTPEMAAHPGLWHPQANLAMAPPMTVPLIQRSREDLTRSVNSRPREWDSTSANTMPRDMPSDILTRDAGGKSLLNGQGGSTEIAVKENSEYQMQRNSKTNSPHLGTNVKERVDPSATGTPQQLITSAVASIAAASERKVSLQDKKSAGSPSPNNSVGVVMDTLAPAVRSKASSPDISIGSRTSSLRGSPVCEDLSTESFGHKKFDKFRKDKGQAECPAVISSKDQSAGVKVTEKMEGLKIKEERMEEDIEEDVEEKDLKIDVSDVKSEKKYPTTDSLSPTVPSSSTPSPNSDRAKLSAREAHPNLLAHLMNGGSNARQTSPHLPSPVKPIAIPSAGIPLGFPWVVPSQMPCTSHPHLQAQLFRHPFNTSTNAGFPGQMTSAPVSLPLSTSPSIRVPSPQPTSLQYNSSDSSALNLSSQINGTSDSKSGNTKEEFHAAAVSHLKDKILRKYDSMENLSKVGKDSSTASGLTGSNTSPCTPTPGQWSKSNSPTIQTVLGGAIDLNKELAIKLTLSSSASSAAVITTSTPPSSSPSITASSTQGFVCSFSNQIPSKTSPPMMPATSSASFDTSSRAASHGVSQLSHMLMSQDSHIPLYHSMMNQPYLGNNSVGPSIHTTSSQSPLANMQHFAQMFMRGQPIPSSNMSDRRLDLGSCPLNLTSRMEDGHVLPGSSSPSHSPQTPA